MVLADFLLMYKEVVPFVVIGRCMILDCAWGLDSLSGGWGVCRLKTAGTARAVGMMEGIIPILGGCVKRAKGVRKVGRGIRRMK
jgi:hypothetical protein